MAIEICKPVLLTGAGFSKDVGGFLGQEMWAQIFNTLSSRSNQRLCCCLKNYDSKDVRNKLDFEKVYDLVMQGRYSDGIKEDQIQEDQQEFLKGLFDVYKALDDQIRTSTISTQRVNFKKLVAFLLKFSGTGNTSGFVFTLNQDLFVERWLSTEKMGTAEGLQLQLPGMHNHPLGMQEEEVTNKGVLTLAQEDTIQTCQRQNESTASVYGRLQYIKLHGSWNWRKGDGSSAMAIGHTKSRLLENEPLFRWYHNIFETALMKDSQRLLVIGYGFRDQHINEIIIKSIEKHGLQLFVVDPQSPENFRDMLPSYQYGGTKEHSSLGGTLMWTNGLAGYFQATLSQLFPKDEDSSESYLMKQIRELVFR